MKEIKDLRKTLDYPSIVKEIIDANFEEALKDILDRGFVVSKIYFKTDGVAEHEYYKKKKLELDLSDNGYFSFKKDEINGLAPSSRGKNQAELYLYWADDGAFNLVKSCYIDKIYIPAYLELCNANTKEITFLKAN